MRLSICVEVSCCLEDGWGRLYLLSSNVVYCRIVTGTTIADIIRNLGPGSLRREDGVTKLSPSLAIQAGKYSWIPAQVPTMRDTEQHGKKLNRFGSFVYC